MSPSDSQVQEEHGPEGRPAGNYIGCHHPDFYFSDGNVIFQLLSDDHPPGCLYKLHAGVLGSRSPFFCTLLSLPRPPDAAKDILSEGKVDSNPIDIPSCISRHDFDSLLKYLYKGPSDYPTSDEFLVSVLKLSSFFEIADGVDFATREFTRRGNHIHPALQFELARCFGIDIWIEHAFRRLMDSSLTSLTSEQVTQIGHCGYYWLTQTKAKIQELRTKIAFHVPPVVSSPGCEAPARCIASWNREWEEHVRQLIHHPESPIRCLDLLSDLRNTHIEGFCDECQDLTATWIWGKCLLTKEEYLIEEAIAALMVLQTEQPLREALRDSVHRLIKS
ncbi:hypothetical protein C8R47DRAFT_1227720 [Mycena vitilis]|nr:hypothetical protein C8R47DRAFT_1227720 [Mycena vitilis]